MIKPYAEFCRLAQTATSLERYDDAIKVAGAGLVQHPDNVPLMQMLAYALGKGGRHYEAALVLEKILDLGAEVEGVLALLSKNYVDIGIYDNRYWDRAIEYADKSIETDGRDSSGHISKAFICLQRAQYEDAFKLCQDALRVNPESDGGVFNMSIAMLANHMWEEGWFCYNKYLHPRFMDGVPEYRVPLWDMESPGKLIVTGEQGLGDHIMFASMLPDLMADHDIILDTNTKIAGLLGSSFGCESHGTKSNPDAEWKDSPDADYWVPMGSLGALYRNQPEDFPGTPYLKPDPDIRYQWKALLDRLGDKPKIGIAWSGGVPNTGEAQRSLSVRDIAPILEYDAEWISLQYKNTDDIPNFVHHWPRAVQSDSYEDTAALIAELDLVIAVTTTVVHCAGALGVKTWCLVPNTPSWRYGTSGDRMHWYDSVELLREDKEWPIQEICRRLSRMNIEKCRNLSTRTPITVLPRSPSRRLSPLLSNRQGLDKYLITGLGKAA